MLVTANIGNIGTLRGLGGDRLVQHRCLGRGDGAAAEQAVAVVEYRRLARRDAIFGIGEAQPRPIPMRRHRRRHRADLGSDRALTLGEPVDPVDAGRSHRQRAARADHEALRRGLDADHIERLGLPADLDPAALADGEMDHALMRAQHGTVQRDDLARRRRFGAQFLDSDA